MKNVFVGEVVVGIVLVVLLVLLVNPLTMYMPNNVEMALLAAAVVAFAVFGALVWRERATDEREEAHRSLAGRVGFLTGAMVLAVGVLVQSLAHRLDVWLAVALGAMVLAKLAALIYSRYRN